jgi:hypothetical protein
MANRRQFIASGLALSAVSSRAISALSATPGTTEATPFLRLERFVVDNRFAEAVEMGRPLASRGTPVSEFAGDLTGLWLDDLDARWKKEPAALAGITTGHGLFVLETLAADRGMRVVYRGEHGVPRDGCAPHVLAGPAALLAQATRQPLTRPWIALGSAMTRCPLGTVAAARLELETSDVQAATRSEPLFTWIIAPRSSLTTRA